MFQSTVQYYFLSNEERKELSKNINNNNSNNNSNNNKDDSEFDARLKIIFLANFETEMFHLSQKQKEE